MYLPLKPGKEYWLQMEMIRKLLLTSTIGFMSTECNFKLMSALLISFIFIVVYVQKKPYVRARHQNLQLVAMLIPTFTMCWALTGLSEDKDGAGEDGNMVGVILLHALMIAPVVIAVLFTLGSTAPVAVPRNT